MNCIQPIAPAELGPMLRPKFDSTLLIAPSTCQGIPYAAPARCQSACSCAYVRDSGVAGGEVRLTGTTTWPGAFGDVAAATSRLGNTVSFEGTIENVLAPAVPASIANAIVTAATMRRTSY